MKLSDKMVKVQETVTVSMYDNGYVVEISGRDSDEEWVTSKILCDTLDKVYVLIDEASKMERD
ncbi:hypothetical protein UFOVP1655_112 [uncultured Caudovirales phage]|uniref:Uncharacterized protein n=1 Tax=uncultured Caudovirales phage TaxID=2100421 RepID=A0A6J5T3Y8_9CAUD|nr:hypothetical protein UFOVP1655_112 [uncultured Caudovirales phage]